MVRILFLDIDGVLNSTQFFRELNETPEGKEKLATSVKNIDPKAVELLNNFTTAGSIQIVVSSSWRFAHRSNTSLREEMERIGLTAHILGMTPQGPDAPRSVEISRWLNYHQETMGMHIDAFAIVDDDSDAGVGLEEHFVKTTFETGLQPEHITKLASILGVTDPIGG